MPAVAGSRTRPWLFAAAAAANVLLLHRAGFSGARCVFLLAVLALPFALTAPSDAKNGWRGVHERPLWPFVANDALALVAIAVTGGLHSPLMPVLVVNTIAMIVIGRQSKAAHGLAAGFTILTALLAIAPGAVTGPPIPRPYFEIVRVLNIGVALYLGVWMMTGAWDGLVSAQRSLTTVRARVAEMTVQRTRSFAQVGSKVANELKNPLAAVKSLLQLEMEAVRAGGEAHVSRPEAERSQRRLEVMSRAIARMEVVLSDYLSFSRPFEELRIGTVDLAEIADAVALLLDGRARAAGIHLERTGTAVYVGGDARRLEEALLNVATNAIEATPAGGVVTIRTERGAGNSALVVQDTGEGISAAILEKVGTPFFTTREDGMGIGVALARAAMVQHGGRLEYASQPGAGTTATLTVPDQLRNR